MTAPLNNDIPMIKGTIVAPTLTWIPETYGKDMFQRVLAKAPEQSRKLAEGPIVSSAWYSLVAFDDLMQLCALEAQKQTGEKPDIFFRRMVMESGNQALVKVYKFVMRMFDPTTLIGKGVPLMKRTYNFGEIHVHENVSGKCRLEFSAIPKAAIESIRQGFPNAIQLVLTGCGATVVDQQITAVFKPDGGSFDITTTYKM